jgi:hypothetical protein
MELRGEKGMSEILNSARSPIWPAASFFIAASITISFLSSATRAQEFLGLALGLARSQLF